MQGVHKMTDEPSVRTITQNDAQERKSISTDICVLGAGMSGLSAALEAKEAGRDVVLVDAAKAIGGQGVGSIVGTLIGLYTHGEEPYQITYGIAEDMIEDLEPRGDLERLDDGRTVAFQYDEVALQRWFEKQLEAAGVDILLGGTMTDASFADRRVQSIDVETEYGSVSVNADSYIDASGDATLAWEAGLAVREPQEEIYGTMNFLIEGYDADAVDSLDMDRVETRLSEVGDEYGLDRKGGGLWHYPEKNFMLANITHMETKETPLGYAEMVMDGRQRADNTVQFLREEFPEIFEGASVRKYGNPGIRQSRWITSREQLTLSDIRSGDRPDGAIARCSWSVELHDSPDDVHWEHFDDGHVYYIPLSCMVPAGADNLVAAGRCVDADTHALSAIRVIGPCIAMGAAAAHALALAESNPVHEVDRDALQDALHDNLERTDT